MSENSPNFFSVVCRMCWDALVVFVKWILFFPWTAAGHIGVIGELSIIPCITWFVTAGALCAAIQAPHEFNLALIIVLVWSQLFILRGAFEVTKLMLTEWYQHTKKKMRKS